MCPQLHFCTVKAAPLTAYRGQRLRSTVVWVQIKDNGIRHFLELNEARSTDTHPSLKKLYFGLSDDEYARLDAWYTRYAALIDRILERIANDPKEYTRFLALTSQSSRHTMTEKVESPTHS